MSQNSTDIKSARSGLMRAILSFLGRLSLCLSALAIDEDSVTSDSERLFPDKDSIELERQDVQFLCQRCRELDFDRIFSLQSVKSGGDTILRFDSERTLVDDERCSFCQAMRFIYPSWDILPEWKRRKTRLVVTTHYDWFGRHSDVTEGNFCLTFEDCHDPTYMVRRWRKSNIYTLPPRRLKREDTSQSVGCLAEKRTIEADSNALPAASIKPRVSFGMIKNGLKQCQRKHKKCRRRRAEYMQKIPGMRLIDCRTRTVVPAPKGNVSYAALSYVWGESGQANFGNGSMIQNGSHTLSENLPKTISDAILVTRKLDIRYLWIDRYCIQQVAETKEEKDEKHGQIARMHQIYGGASVTIIAAAGKGPDHGLPGVRTKRRSPTVRLHNRTLFATLPDPKYLVDASVWATRGWTFQEGLLARRVLVFTEQQVYFQCGEGANTEAWEECHEKSIFETLDVYRNTPLHPYFALDHSDHPSIWLHISKYVRLDMREPQDILNGILGVLTYYERISEMRHVAGLPVDPDFSNPVLWPQELAEALSWQCDEPGERRAGFPTWSWTGWTCKGFQRNQWVSQRSNTVNNPSVQERLKPWSISIEEHTEESTHRSDLVALLDGSHDLSQVTLLHVTAPSLEADIVPMDGISEENQSSSLVFDNNEKLLGVRYPRVEKVSPINLTDSNWLKSPLPSGKIQCFAILMDEGLLETDDDLLKQYVSSLATALIVIRKEDAFEKIGVSDIDRQMLRRAGSVVREFQLR